MPTDLDSPNRKRTPDPHRARRPRLRAARAGAIGAQLTTPDLVLLSLLAERPMHGYQANRELERREVRDWAGISRPQVYYSLEKLSRSGWIRSSESAQPVVGPERATFRTTGKGLQALGAALEGEHWATQRDRPPFLTWLALSSQARTPVVYKQIKRRSEFLAGQLAREQATLRAVRAESGPPHLEAVWMITLVIRQFKTELGWLETILAELPERGRAKSHARLGRAGKKPRRAKEGPK